MFVWHFRGLVNLTASWSAGVALERPLTQPTHVSKQNNGIQRQNQFVKHGLVMLVSHASSVSPWDQGSDNFVESLP